MNREIIVNPRFNGPPGYGNGGYVGGLMAQALGGACIVTLKAPTPLEKPLALIAHGAGARLVDGDAVIAEAALAPLDLEPPAAVSAVDARAASKHYAGFAQDAFATCFVCGVARAPGDGMHIYAGPAPGRDMVAACWRPGDDLADESGLVRAEFLWAALDCPGYFAVYSQPALALLGRFHAAVSRRPRAGEELVVGAWPIAVEPRKFHAGSALYDENGEVIAKARATWVRLRPDFQLAT